MTDPTPPGSASQPNPEASWESEEERLFAAALTLPRGPERERLLARECGVNEALLRRVTRLIAVYEAFGPSEDGLPGQTFVERLAPRNPEGGSLLAALDDAPQIDRYRISRPIGEGGCGTVYLAEQETPVRRTVAVKVIKPGMDSRQVIARFELERQTLAMLDHPNIARIFDAGGTRAGRPYFAMEFVSGQRITHHCEANALDLPARLELFIQVCQAIQHAHQKGVVHRDIKPSNILVSMVDGAPVPKVIDFGIAKAIDTAPGELTNHTEVQHPLGTPAYMSPEQVGGNSRDLDTRTDVYSLGILLYELLTGHTPFDGRALVAKGMDGLRRTILEEEPTPPSALSRQAVPESPRTGASPPRFTFASDLDWIVMKCLEKDRARRYASVNGLILDVRRFLDHEPILARPPSRGYKIRKFARRNRLAVSAAASIALALLLGTAVSMRLAVEADSERKKAVAAKTIAETERNRAEASEKEAQQLLYAAKINLMQSSWDQGVPRRVSELLAETGAFTGRGFEWFYWQRVVSQALLILRTEQGEILATGFAQDGRTLITAGDDGLVRLWDANTGREKGLLRGHARTVRAAAFSFDSRRIVTGSDDRTVRVWDSGDGRELFRLRGHTDRITTVAFDPAGRRVASGGFDRTVVIWSADTGAVLARLPTADFEINGLAFSPNGRILAVGGEGGFLATFDTQSGRVVRRFPLSQHAVLGLAVSHDGQKLATANSDRLVRLWSLDSGENIATLPGHTRKPRFLSFSPDDSLLLSGGDDRSAQLWDVPQRREFYAFRGFDGGLTGGCFSPDGRKIVVASRDGTASVHSVPSQNEELVFAPQGQGVNALAFSEDNRYLAMACVDTTARVRDLAAPPESARKPLPKLTGHTGGLNALVFLGTTHQLATGSDDGTLRIWDAADRRTLQILDGHGGPVWAVASSQDGHWVATGSDDHAIRIWNTGSGILRQVMQGHAGPVTGVDISRDGAYLASSSEDGTAILWNFATGELIRVLRGHRGMVTTIHFASDGSRVVTAGADRTARVWSVPDGRLLTSLNGHSETIWTARFSPDGRRVVTGSRDRSARVWEAEKGNELLNLRRHADGVAAAVFSPDGQLLVSADNEGLIRTWRAAPPSEQSPPTMSRPKERTEDPPQPNEVRPAGLVLPAAGSKSGVDHWLTALPIPITPGDVFWEVLGDGLGGKEGQLQPTEGQIISIHGTRYPWTVMPTEQGVLDFNHALGTVGSHSVALAASYVHAGQAHTNLVIQIGNEEQARIFLNGEEIYSLSHPHATATPEADAVAGVALRPGMNILIFECYSSSGPWKASLRFTDENGADVPDLTYSTSP